MRTLIIIGLIFLFASLSFAQPIVNLSAASAYPNTIKLSWSTDFTGRIYQWDVYRSVDGINFTRIGRALSSALRTYTDTGLQWQTKYYYKIKMTYDTATGIAVAESE